ncbi:hypothetical protein [Megalodesulfovibrio gigas]|uniref:Uncharacterized protein n=1 Tax=Megalodesulfovibrio gigas (strain ATCC 19364 / DSM 1382 / NCIMB 9332 / VKM B-1759) TaxID=1121448 RepID=T2G7J7_MEGG1|nr:hypothetical protein [Megalodesulfovibrio gigas]AGW12096.1 hypothetical protein DGI_0159 [Megalodesulfovibrio gigas DSM 1382 = ATCC 19364]
MADLFANAWVRLAFAATVDHADACLYLELDDAMHRRLYGEARSAFRFGESVYLRIHAWPASMRLTFALSDGVLAVSSGGEETRTETICLAGSARASLNLPAVDDSLTVQRWLGRSLPGALQCAGTLVTAPGVVEDAPVAAVAEVRYRTAWIGRRFVLPWRDASAWTVCLAVRGEVEEGSL